VKNAVIKISKAAVIFYTRAIVAEHETEDLHQEVKKMEKVASWSRRKCRSRVLVQLGRY
jgi:hypothetical protein